MASTLTESTLLTKEQTGRRYIGEFLAAMHYHDPDLQNTIKLMRKKLVEIQRRTEAAKKPPTVRKLIIKFGGSSTSLPIAHPHSETLVISGDHNSKTLTCKRQKINETDHMMQLNDSTPPVFLENPKVVNVMDFIESIGGSDAELVIEKMLTRTDVTVNQGRLLIPVLKVCSQGFLTADEKILLGKKQDISVPVFDPKRRKLMLNLAKWSMSKECFVLKTNWNQVVKTNRFKEGTMIRVLSFRVHYKLCFALDRVI
ncbi:B3 domain-containing protein At1g05920-like [Bidens hawaiensis]|uniref:B3 domain-containing protein At1g05920-like n=1 Tax=Bidens hawaiensis TaxID=980011 RepID=UPI004049004C